jgi:hypothetical protein
VEAPAAAPAAEPGRAVAAPPEAAAAAPESLPAECFALPHQVKMPLREFLALLHSGRQHAVGQQQQRQRQGGAAASAGPAALEEAAASAPGVVPYLQYQNSSLTTEVPQLLGDVDLLLSWADEAFGKPAGHSSRLCLMSQACRAYMHACVHGWLQMASCGSGTACRNPVCLTEGLHACTRLTAALLPAAAPCRWAPRGGESVDWR